MDPAAIREAVRTRPFQPFRLRLADGRELNVPHPDLVAVAPNGRRVVVFNTADDTMATLEPLLIVSLEVAVNETETGGTKGNGAVS
jgi:hypothetical protein